jgi:hypothetical protein
VRVLLRNGYFCGSAVFAWGKHATVFPFATHLAQRVVQNKEQNSLITESVLLVKLCTKVNARAANWWQVYKVDYIVMSGTGSYVPVSEAVPTNILNYCCAASLFAGWADARVFGYARTLHRLPPFLLRQLRSQGKRSKLEQWNLRTCTAWDCTYAFHRFRCILHNCGTGCGSLTVVIQASSCIFSRSSSASGLVLYT